MKIICGVAAALLLILSAPGFAAEGSETKKPKTMRDYIETRTELGTFEHMHGKRDNGALAGTVAPDFELMPLKFYEFGISEEDITQENAQELYAPVRLSDFKGKKPVVLIFGSYT